MKTFVDQAAQGDLLIRRIDTLPDELTLQSHEKQLIVAHSETGHHHAIDAAPDVVQMFGSADPLISYLKVCQPVELKHHRSFDTHEALQIDIGTYELRRQREHTPEGWRMVMD